MEYSVCFASPPDLGVEIANGTIVGWPLVDVVKQFCKAANINLTMVIGKNWVEDIFISENCEIFAGMNSLDYDPAATVAKISIPFHYVHLYLASRCEFSHEARSTEIDVNYPIIFGLAICIPILSLISYVAEETSRRKSLTSNERKTPNIWEFMWMYFSNIFLEPSQYCERSASLKILETVWFFSLVFILGCFGGGMKANLFLIKETRYDSVDAALVESSAEIIVPHTAKFGDVRLNAAFGAETFKKFRAKRNKEFWKKCHPDQVEEIFPDVLAGKAVLVLDDSHFVKVLDTALRHAGKIRVSQQFSERFAVFYLRDDVPDEVIEILNQCLLRMVATQLLAQIQRKYDPLHSSSCEQENGSNQKLGDISWLIVIFIFFNTLAGCVCIFECVYFKLLKSSKSFVQERVENTRKHR